MKITTNKITIWITIIASIFTIIGGIITIYSFTKTEEGLTIEQTIPKELLEKHKNGDTTIKIEKGITIKPNSDEG